MIEGFALGTAWFNIYPFVSLKGAAQSPNMLYQEECLLETIERTIEILVSLRKTSTDEWEPDDNYRSTVPGSALAERGPLTSKGWVVPRLMIMPSCQRTVPKPDAYAFSSVYP